VAIGIVIAAFATVLATATTSAGPVTCVRTRVATGISIVGPVVDGTGQVWFATEGGDESVVGRIDADGELHVTDLPSDALDIVLGPDGAVWTSSFDSVVRRWGATGQLLGSFPGVFGDQMVVGPDGNVWAWGINGSSLSRITPAGVVSLFFMNLARFKDIVAGSDGRLWSVGGSQLNPELRAFSTDGVWDFGSPGSNDDFFSLDRQFIDTIDRGPGADVPRAVLRRARGAPVRPADLLDVGLRDLRGLPQLHLPPGCAGDPRRDVGVHAAPHRGGGHPPQRLISGSS